MTILRYGDACLDPLVVVMWKAVNYFYTSFDGKGAQPGQTKAVY